MTLTTLSERLTNHYDRQEARSIIRILLEDTFHLTYTEMLTGAIDNLTDHEKDKLNTLITRVANGEPVQYVTGQAPFCHLPYHVAPGVLIPRPETEELCQWILDDGIRGDILDIGTGSGCIAITLQRHATPPFRHVVAWDISTDALRIAQDNARHLHADVTFRQQDALLPPEEDHELWDIIVSNPPYICHKEASAMQTNVLDHEPSLALFVPDHDPLLFYRSIAAYATHALRPSGALYFEINPIYAQDICHMLTHMHYHHITIRKDQFGKSRMIKCIK